MSKSAFGSGDKWNYRRGTDFYAISGTYLMHEGQQARFSIRSSAGEDKKLTRDGKALYLHCLPADISGVSCETGEVDASVFDRYRTPLYKEASFKPYIIAAMIFLSKFENPQEILKKLEERGTKRVFG